MNLQAGAAQLRLYAANQRGLTLLTAVFMVMLIGVTAALTGKSWTAIMKREREKELLFRGSQIKEAIENFNNENYSVNGVKRASKLPLMDLKDLLQDRNSLTKLKYLPQSYAVALDDKNPRCAPDCAKLKIYEDPMTGKEWTIIRGNIVNGVPTPVTAGVRGAGITAGAGIIGVASKSDEEPYKTDFKDTALENMGKEGAPGTPAATTPPKDTKITETKTTDLTTTSGASQGLGSKMTKYSEWKFIYDRNNDHTKIYRAYHEGW